ncbi:MarR family winged helix-turn-helix transcriptional regulator [Streptomyces lavenduligriseus]|uniref:MarR family winged helix-turn-helix transcriptional regulator n=1 Tax=Streptomyces lavenduligriseus TaxID=67315 RepID=A0ABT0P3C1_9ACTN|nr:MarR family winged helix-turn-helix transcriptional regulator [Streptomyces lavenduligriseus]MCL3998250.1 MarR family winged helix-turn-helix transcriptional regulator [Streptomyces lavenduligriseus]
MSTESNGPAVDEAVRTLLLLMPRLVGRAKRLPIPAALQGMDLAPRHLALLAHLEYDGPTSVNDLAARLEVAPTTVSLMVSELSRLGVLQRTADPADRRRRIIAISPAFAAPIGEWLSGSASAWESVMRGLTPAERATVITALHGYEAALERAGSRHRGA